MTLGEKPSVQKLFEIAPPVTHILPFLVQEVMRPVSKNPSRVGILMALLIWRNYFQIVGHAESTSSLCQSLALVSFG